MTRFRGSESWNILANLKTNTLSHVWQICSFLSLFVGSQFALCKWQESHWRSSRISFFSWLEHDHDDKVVTRNRATELGAATSETRSAWGQRTVHFAASVANTARRRIDAATNSVDWIHHFFI